MGHAQEQQVSVVVPIHDVEDYVAECVDSVLAQSYSNLEVILVDDGSSDASGKLCDAFAARDGRVQVVHQMNHGLSAARNVGLARASGPLVTFIDGDDWWDVGFVETLVAALDDHPTAGLSMSSYERVPGRAWVGPSPHRQLLAPDVAVSLFASRHHGLFTTACAKVYRRDALREVTFPIGRLHEDEFTTYQVLMRVPSVLVPEPLYKYRQRSNGITASVMTPERLLDAIDAADTQAEAFAGAGHARAAGWAQDQALRKRMRLVTLLDQSGDRSGAAEQRVELRRAARRGRHCAHPPVWRVVRGLAGLSPRLAVRLFSTLSTRHSPRTTDRVRRRSTDKGPRPRW